VRDQHDRQPIACAQIAEQRQHPLGGFPVYFTGRFVAKQDTRSVRQRTRQGDALLLTTRQLRDRGRSFVRDSNCFQQLIRPRAPLASATARKGHQEFDILACAQVR
jgi:hypothetical protein